MPLPEPPEAAADTISTRAVKIETTPAEAEAALGTAAEARAEADRLLALWPQPAAVIATIRDAGREVGTAVVGPGQFLKYDPRDGTLEVLGGEPPEVKG